MLTIHRDMNESTGYAKVAITGSADLAAADQFQLAMNLLVAARPKHLEFDLAGLAFICSLSIGALVTVQMTLRAEGSTMVLRNVQPLIHQCLFHSRLNEVFKIE